MRHIWAPWRMKYIVCADDKQQGCIFCNALKAKDDQKYQILIRRENCFAMMNKFPYNSGHLMVASNKHTGDLSALSKEIMADVMELTVDCQKIINEVMSPEGFNLGINNGKAAGAGIVDHIHMHIVPRWNGDTNFMPVLSDTRVVPQALEDTYQILLKKKIELFGE